MERYDKTKHFLNKPFEAEKEIASISVSCNLLFSTMSHIIHITLFFLHGQSTKKLIIGC